MGFESCHSTCGCSDYGYYEEGQKVTDSSACDSSSIWSDSNSDADSVSAPQEIVEGKVGAAPKRLDDWGMSAILGAGFRLGKFVQQDLSRQTLVRHATRQSDFNSFAVKTCSAAKGIDFANQFNSILSEYDLLQGLVHPSIVSVAYLFHSKHDIWLFREWCVDGCLWSYVQKHGELGEPRAFRLIDQMVEGIHYLHSKSIAHQNIQPGNVLLTRHTETLKIAGFSKAESNSFNFNSETTQPEMPVVLQREQLRELAHESKAWMAPEQICGGQKSQLVDIWAGGLCAGFMLLCRHPFSSKTLTSDEAANAHVLREAVKSMCRGKRPAVQLHSLSTSAVALLEACLRSNPATRVSSQELRLHPVLIWNAVEDQHLSHQNSLQASIESFQRKSRGCLPTIQAGGDLPVMHRQMQSLTANEMPPLRIRRNTRRHHSDTLRAPGWPFFGT